jgi:hypothetical protein
MPEKPLRELDQGLRDGTLTLGEYNAVIEARRKINREKQKAYRQRLKTGENSGLRRIEITIPGIVPLLVKTLSEMTGITQRALVELALMQFVARHVNFSAVGFASDDVRKLANINDDMPPHEAYQKIVDVKFSMTVPEAAAKPAAEVEAPAMEVAKPEPEALLTEDALDVPGKAAKRKGGRKPKQSTAAIGTEAETSAVPVPITETDIAEKPSPSAQEATAEQPTPKRKAGRPRKKQEREAAADNEPEPSEPKRGRRKAEPAQAQEVEPAKPSEAKAATSASQAKSRGGRRPKSVVPEAKSKASGKPPKKKQ